MIDTLEWQRAIAATPVVVVELACVQPGTLNVLPHIQLSQQLLVRFLDAAGAPILARIRARGARGRCHYTVASASMARTYDLVLDGVSVISAEPRPLLDVVACIAVVAAVPVRGRRLDFADRERREHLLLLTRDVIKTNI